MRLIDTIAKRLGYERPTRERAFTAGTIEIQPYEEAYGRKGDDYTANLGHAAIHATVYAAASRVAAYASSVPFLVKRSTKAGDDDIFDHDAVAIMDRPNPHQDGRQFIEQTILYLIATGNAYCPHETDAGLSEFWHLSPARCVVLPDRQDYIRGYQYEVNGVKRQYDIDGLMHIKLGTDPRPGRHYYGLGPLQAAMIELAADYDAQTHQSSILKNRGIPSGLIYPKDPDVVWQTSQIDQIQASFEKMQSKRRGGVAVMNGMAEFKQLAQTFADMEFSKLRGWTREQIASAIGCPPVLLGLLEGATFANAEQQMRAFVDVLDKLYLGAIASARTTFLRRVGIMREDERGAFDLSSLRTDIMPPESRAENAAKAFSGGILSRDEVRDIYYNLGPGPEPDIYAIPGGVTVVDAETGEPAEAFKPAPPPVPVAPMPPDAALDNALHSLRAASVPMFKQRQAPVERRMQELAAEHFRETADIVLTNIRRRWPTPHIESVYPVMQGKERVEDRFGDALIEHYLDFAGVRPDRSDSGSINRLDFPPYISDDPELMNAIEELLEGLHHIEDTTAAEIAAIIREEYESGTATLEGVIERIRSNMDGWPTERARLVAETITTSLANAGENTRINRDDSVEFKVWRTMQDDLVRDRHQDLMGQRVKKNEKFGNGLRYPGDPSGGDPSEIVRCRCYMDAE